MAIALKESRETHYWLRLMEASAMLPPEKLSGLLQESDELGKIIGAIIVNSKK